MAFDPYDRISSLSPVGHSTLIFTNLRAIVKRAPYDRLSSLSLNHLDLG